jgi:putative DNA primase/helicase
VTVSILDRPEKVDNYFRLVDQVLSRGNFAAIVAKVVQVAQTNFLGRNDIKSRLLAAGSRLNIDDVERIFEDAWPTSESANSVGSGRGVATPNGRARDRNEVWSPHLINDVRQRKSLVLDPADPMAAARALRDAHFLTGGIPTLQRHRGGFWRWTGDCYRPIDDEPVKSTIWSFLDGCSRRGKDEQSVPFKPNRAQVSNVHEALIAVSQLDDALNPPAWLTGDAGRPLARELFACRNGILHLPTGKLLAATPEFFNIFASEAAFEPSAPAPDGWLKFLDEIWGADGEAIQTLQEWFGYSISPDTSQQKILLLVGPKRSGKGTIARVLSAVLGLNSVVGPTMSSLGERFGLEPLIPSPAAVISDARIGARSDKTTITERLLSISGEDMLAVDRKFRAAWTGRLPTRIVILTNELPALSDGAGALASRFLVLPMTKTFYGKEDPGLTNKLLAELPGILNWAVEGYRSLNRRGHFAQPKSGAEAREDIELLAAPVRAFLLECCEVAPGRTVTVDGLWMEYQAWCVRERRDAGNKSWFGRNLLSAAPGVKKRQIGPGDDRKWLYEGLGLER